MKNLFLLLTVLCLFCSCSKDDVSADISVDGTSENNEKPNSNLIGKWKWTKSTGGIGGIEITPASTNKVIVLEISNDRIKVVEDGKTISDESYTIQSKKSIYGGQKEMIVYEKNAPLYQSYEIKESELLINDECFDCFTHSYIKK